MNTTMKLHYGLLFLSCMFAVIPSSLARGGGKKKMTMKGGGKKKRSGKHETCSIGIVQVRSTRSFDETYSALIDSLNNDADMYIAKEFDAAMVAGMAGVNNLLPNRVVIFGNAALGGPFLQADQTAAIDMPQKIHVYEASNGKVFVGYNSPYYLEARYEALDDLDGLETLGTALKTLAANAAGVDPSTIKDKTMHKKAKEMMHKHSDHKGIHTFQSKVDFDTTWQRVVDAIPANDFILVASVDHQEKAASKGIQINPTRLMMLCKPAFDATFAQANQCAVIDFPLKLLVTENAGGVVEVSMSRFGFLKKRHYISKGSVDENVYHEVMATVGRIVEEATSA